MKLKVVVDVDAPDGATHYAGLSLIDDPDWYKCTQVGVVGDHWWCWDFNRNEWVLGSHSKPNFLKEIQPEVIPENWMERLDFFEKQLDEIKEKLEYGHSE